MSGRVAQKGGSARHGGQDAALSFDTQLLIDSTELRDESRTNASD